MILMMFGASLGLMLAGGAEEAPAATRTVDTVSDGGGLSACTAAPDDCSLRGAISDAAAGDTIDFASPLFDSPQIITLSEAAGFQELVINKNLTITGKGAHLTTVRRSPLAAAQFRIFYILSSTVSISGLTITGGRSSGDGGGILFTQGTLMLTAVHLTGNTAEFNGGIFSRDAGSLTVINSTISNNTANNDGTGAGGGISDYNGTLTSTNSTVSGNRVPNGDGKDGGGFFVYRTNPFITNSTITDNEVASSSSAGGVFIRFSPGTITVRNSIIAGNCTRATSALCSNATTPDVGIEHGAFASQGYNLIGNVGGQTVFNQTGDHAARSASSAACR